MFGRSQEEPSPQARLAGATTSAAGAPDRNGIPEGLILLVFAIVTLAAIALVLGSAASKAKDDPAQQAARGDLKGLDKGSLVLEENLRKVLAKVDASDHPLVTNIRVSPIRVDLITRNADGLRKDVSYDPGFNKTESDFGAGDDKAIRASKLDASAPERMARSVGERTGLGTDSLDYVTLSPSPTSAAETEWYLFLDKGPFKSRQWVAAPDGRDLRHPGEPSRKEKAATRRQARQMKADQRRTQRAFAQQSACLNRATDANAAARCVERYQP